MSSSQVLLAIPLVMLYGISIVILKFVNPASKLADFSDDESDEASPTTYTTPTTQDSKDFNKA